MIETICNSTLEYINSMSKEKRKKYGQFFTSKETATFMASLFDVELDDSTVSILDPGAGSGILSGALIERLQDYPIDTINLTCYENDEQILPLLLRNLELIAEYSSIQINYQIICDNYITSQEDDFNELSDNSKRTQYDFVIANPPYMKIPKDAKEAQAMPKVCYGAPNLYFLFASMSIFNLKDNCEMVYIIPRSWTSGAYFKYFRDYLFSLGVIKHIHLFVSRDKVFEQEKVLQETIIIKIQKQTVRPEFITMTTTNTNNDFSNITQFDAPYDAVVSGTSNYVYLITNEQEISVLSTLNRWKSTLPDLGLKMKTGLTVDFRNNEFLRDDANDETVPLFYTQHIKEGKVQFPVHRKGEFIETERNGLLQANSNYLFVKRFTSKEENKRLQCGIYLSDDFAEYDQISTQNKLNFIAGSDELSEITVYGLYTLFNSSLYDMYYRILNGSTQVNSTEVNSMPVPPLGVIEQMGQDLIEQGSLSEDVCDEILVRYL